MPPASSAWLRRSQRARAGGWLHDRALSSFPNAIDTARFAPPGAEERPRARRSLELPASATVLLHLGWAWHRKGGDLFLEAVAALVAAGCGGLAAIAVGGGAEARDAVARLGLERTVRVIEPDPDVRRLYAAADLLVSSSRAEGMPYAVMEALSSELPVVATRIPGHVAIAREAEAMLVTGHDPDELAAGIRSVLAWSAGERASRTKAGRAALIRGRDLSSWADRLLDLYERALPGKPQGR